MQFLDCRDCNICDSKNRCGWFWIPFLRKENSVRIFWFCLCVIFPGAWFYAWAAGPWLVSNHLLLLFANNWSACHSRQLGKLSRRCGIFEARLLRLNWICWTFVLGRQSLLSSQHHLVKTELGTQTCLLFRFAPQLHRLWEFRQARRWTESSHFSIEQRIQLVGRQRPQGERKRRAFAKRSGVSPILDVPGFWQLVKFRELARLPRRLTSSTAAFSTKLVVQVSKLGRIDKLPCFSKLLRWRLLDALVYQYLHLSIS